MTIEINLLPWRALRRQRSNRRFRASMLVAVVVGLGAGYALLWHYSQQLSTQQQRLDYLKQQSAMLQRPLARVDRYEIGIDARVQQLDALQLLSRERSRMVELLEALAASLQEDVYYTAVKRKGLNLTLTAVALTDSGVASQLQALGAQNVLSEPHFSALELTPQGRRFTLSVMLHAPETQQSPLQERLP